MTIHSPPLSPKRHRLKAEALGVGLLESPGSNAHPPLQNFGYRDSQSFNFLLPLGLSIAALIPAIFALYFARRGSLNVHLQNKHTVNICFREKI
jgi:hypothetical protein